MMSANEFLGDDPQSASAFLDAEPNITTDVGKSAASGLAKAASYAMNPMGVVRNSGNAVLGGATRLAGAGYEALGGELSPGMAQWATYPFGNGSDATSIMQNQVLPTAVQAITGMNMDYQPETGLGRATQSSIESLPYVAGSPAAGIRALGIGGLGEAGSEVAKWMGFGEKGQQVGQVLGGAAGAGIPEIYDSVKPLPKFQGDIFQNDINNNFENARNSRKPFYDFMKNISKGQVIDTTPVMGKVKTIISDLEDSPFAPERPVLARLKQFVSDYEGNPEMPVADAVELQQDINQHFNPKKFTQGAKNPYFQVGKFLQDEIGKAGEANPVFSAAKELADKNHVDNVANAFTNNKLLQDVWNSEDYYASKGVGSYTPDATKLRARTMLDNIKTPEQLDAATRVMSPELAAKFRAYKLADLKSGGMMYRAEEAGNALGEPLSGIKHLWNMLKGQPYTEAESNLIKSAKQQSPSLTNYSPQLQELKAIPNPRFSPINQQRTLPSPSSQLGLPAPEVPIVGESGINPNLRLQTPEEFARANAATKDINSNPNAALAVARNRTVSPQSLTNEFSQVQNSPISRYENATSEPIQRPEYSQEQVSRILTRAAFNKYNQETKQFISQTTQQLHAMNPQMSLIDSIAEAKKLADMRSGYGRGPFNSMLGNARIKSNK